MREAVFKRIYADLRGKITSAQLKAGDRLDTESKLAAAYGVSEPTIRHAQQLLVDDGLIVKQQGRGTFVAELPSGIRRVLLVCGIMSDPGVEPSVYYSHTIRRCREQLALQGVSTDVVWIENHNIELAQAYSDPRRLRDFTGYIFLGCSDFHPLLQAARRASVNWVLLGRLQAEPHAVWRDVQSGVELALAGLMASPHMRPEVLPVIVALHGRQTVCIRAMLTGHPVAARILEIPTHENTVEHEIEAYRQVREYLSTGGSQRILFADDVLARGGTRALLEAQNKTPMVAEVAVLSNILAAVPYGMPVHYVVHDSSSEADDAIASLVTQIEGMPARSIRHGYFALGRHPDMTPAVARSLVNALPTQMPEVAS